MDCDGGLRIARGIGRWPMIHRLEADATKD
jgi:hypothetical protein